MSAKTKHEPVIHFVAPVPGSGYGGCGGLGCTCGFKPSEPSRADYHELDAHLVAEGLAPTNGWFPGTDFGPPHSETFREEKRAWQQASGVQMRCRHCSEIGTYQELEAHAALAHPA